MKKICIILLLAHNIAPAAAQHCATAFLGSKTLYANNNGVTPAPAGYSPVFINHVGRHGARHLTSDVTASAIAQLITKADSLGGLTETGKLLLEKIKRLALIEKPNIKSISFEGKAEQQELARSMFKNYSAVFDVPKPVINIVYTKEIRTLQTSEAFMGELLSKINTPATEKKINDTTLRFYDLSPAYLRYKKDGNWLASMRQLKNELHYNELAATITQLFFTKEYQAQLTEQDQDEFTSGLYGYIAIVYSIQKEINEAGYAATDLDMEQFLSCTQLSLLGKIDNAEDFLLKGPATNNDGIQVKIAAPLLANFINTTDDYIKTRSANVQLRFSHAETIAPFAALLSLASASTTENNPASIHHVWNASRLIPLSANIQWVLYKRKKGTGYLIKFLLNEKETGITGLSTKNFPYYNWQTVRNFYLKKLTTLQLMPGQNYFSYLQQLK